MGGKASPERFLIRWSHPSQTDEQIAQTLRGLQRRYEKGST